MPPMVKLGNSLLRVLTASGGSGTSSGKRNPSEMIQCPETTPVRV